MYEPLQQSSPFPPRVHSDTDRLRNFLAFGVVALSPSEVTPLGLCVMGDTLTRSEPTSTASACSERTSPDHGEDQLGYSLARPFPSSSGRRARPAERGE